MALVFCWHSLKKSGKKERNVRNETLKKLPKDNEEKKNG